MATLQTAKILQEFIRLKFEFRMNELDDSIELNNERFTDALRARVHNQLNDAGINSVKRIDHAILDVAAKNAYHPIGEHLDALPDWDGADHIGALMNYIIVDDIYHDGLCNWGRLFLQRWLVGAVAKIYQRTQNFCLVLDGRQGVGKSSFGRWLCPIPDYYSEAPFKAADNDSRLRKMRTWIWEIGELQQAVRRADREALKHEISEIMVVARRPYARFDTIKPNITSFIGTMNETGTGFLNDPTGSRRFAAIKITDIDWRTYTERLTPTDIWIQAKALYESGEPWHLSPEERHKQEEYNRQYETLSPIEELFDDVYHLIPDPEDDDWTPAMDIIWELENNHGLKGNQTMHLRNLAEMMTKRGVESGRPRIEQIIRGKLQVKRLRSYKGVEKR